MVIETPLPDPLEQSLSAYFMVMWLPCSKVQAGQQRKRSFSSTLVLITSSFADMLCSGVQCEHEGDLMELDDFIGPLTAV